MPITGRERLDIRGGVLIMGRFVKSADACEYGRAGLMGWAQDHAIVCVLGAVLAWLAVLYAVFSSVLTLG
jgi:hypothetical protein